MTKTKIEKEIERLCQETISYKGLAMAYRTGLRMFKADVVNFITSNFHVLSSFKQAWTGLEARKKKKKKMSVGNN